MEGCSPKKPKRWNYVVARRHIVPIHVRRDSGRQRRRTGPRCRKGAPWTRGLNICSCPFFPPVLVARIGAGVSLSARRHPALGACP